MTGGRAAPVFCTTCGEVSGFRFCSDACFLAHARTRVGVVCAVCQFDPISKRIGNPFTNRLCQECRAFDAANADWCDTRDQAEEFVETRAVLTRLADMQGKPLRPAPPARSYDAPPVALEQRILDLVLLGPPEAWEDRPYFDAHGRRRGTRRYRVVGVRRKLSFREIARRVGCSHTFVRLVVKKSRW